MKNEQNYLELISALMDGESATPEEDALLLHADPLLEKRQTQYQEIGRLMRTLPAPDPSIYFVEEVLAQLSPKKQHHFMRISFTLAAAAALLLAFSVGVYTLLPDQVPELTNPTHTLASDTAASLAAFDTPETTLISKPVETFENNEFESTMAQFETIPEEALIIALAEMVIEEEQQYYATTEDTLTVPTFWNKWPTTSSSFPDVFLLLETLDNAETAALNTMLREALAET